jgi:hypothetical protein
MTTLTGSRDPATLIAGLAATPDRLEALLRDADAPALDAAPPGEWSARTVLAHLRDDEFMVGRLRVERMAVEDHPALTPFDEQAWAASNWNAGDPAPDLLADFRAQRQATLLILRRLQDSDWRRTGFQPEIGEFDLLWFVEHWLDHDENHLAQIAAALGKTEAA